MQLTENHHPDAPGDLANATGAAPAVHQAFLKHIPRSSAVTQLDVGRAHPMFEAPQRTPTRSSSAGRPGTHQRGKGLRPGRLLAAAHLLSSGA